MQHTVGATANNEVLENLRLELRRGCLILAVLAELRSERYGYTLRKALAQQGLEIDEGTLYPLLRRLESQGLLASEWRGGGERKKTFYPLPAHRQHIFKKNSRQGERITAHPPENLFGLRYLCF